MHVFLHFYPQYLLKDILFWDQAGIDIFQKIIKNSFIVFWKEQTINRINWKYLFVRIFGIFVTLCYGRPMSPEGGSNILLVCSEHTTHIDISIIKKHHFRFHYNMKFPKYVLFPTDQTFKEILDLPLKL